MDLMKKKTHLLIQRLVKTIKNHYYKCMDHFDKLHPLIKCAIAVPITILILALFIQTSRTDRGASNMKSMTIPNNDAREYSAQVGAPSLTDSFLSGAGDRFDLNKPQVCSYTGDDITVEAQIKDKQI